MEFSTKTSVLTSQLFMYNWPFLAFYFSLFLVFMPPQIFSVPSFTCFWFLPLVQKMLRRATPIDWTWGLRLLWNSAGRSPNRVSVPRST